MTKEEQVLILTNKPVTAVTTHVHYDYFDSHKYFPDFNIHEAEAEWINGGFPLTLEQVRIFYRRTVRFPMDFDANNYYLFERVPTNAPLLIIEDMDKAFKLHNIERLKHGSGTFTYSNFAIKL